MGDIRVVQCLDCDIRKKIHNSDAIMTLTVSSVRRRICSGFLSGWHTNLIIILVRSNYRNN